MTMETAHFAFAAYNAGNEQRDLLVKAQPVIDKRTLKTISYGAVQALMERRNLSFGKVADISLGFGTDRGPFTPSQAPELIVDEALLTAADVTGDGVMLPQVDGPRSPRLPVRRLGHMTAEDAERLVVPRALLTRDQRARLQDRGEFTEPVRFARFVRDELEVPDMLAGYMQQLMLRVHGVTDPHKAYPVKVVQYERGLEQPTGVFYVVFVRRYEAVAAED